MEPERSPASTNQGHLLLQWEAAGTEEPAIFELQQAADAAFSPARTAYRGPDAGTYVSGLPEGSTWFRVRAIAAGDAETETPGPWSEPLRVEVDYVSMTTVTLLMTCGLVMLLTLVGLILVGTRRARKGTHA